MSPQDAPTPDAPIHHGQQSPVEIENRLTALETTVSNLPTSDRVAALETTVGNLPDLAVLRDDVTKNTTTIKNSRWWFMAIVALFTGIGVAIGSLTRVFAILINQ